GNGTVAGLKCAVGVADDQGGVETAGLVVVIPLARSSTLFPYTTLFRSDLHRRVAVVVPRMGHRGVERHAVARAEGQGAVVRDRLGRRGTRLHSSHLVASHDG